MSMGKDKGPSGGGPDWIWGELEYRENKDKTEVVVYSNTMKTPIDYPIKASAGFHYCKVLSPARVMEWLYVDGLKARYNIKDQDQEVTEILA